MMVIPPGELLAFSEGNIPAAVAAVSIDYYIRLEQGKRLPSPGRPPA
jgi:hypothetical protein